MLDEEMAALGTGPASFINSRENAPGLWVSFYKLKKKEKERKKEKEKKNNRFDL